MRSNTSAWQDLFQENATSRQDLDNAVVDLASSKAQLAEVRARLDRTEIFSPLTGVLNDLPVERGEYVGAGTPVAEVVDMAVVKVVVDVPERDIAFFAVGQEAGVLLDLDSEGRDGPVTGMITYINELADPQTRSTAMEIMLDNGDRTLRSGQIVRVRLTRRTLDDAILIPLTRGDSSGGRLRRVRGRELCGRAARHQAGYHQGRPCPREGRPESGPDAHRRRPSPRGAGPEG